MPCGAAPRRVLCAYTVQNPTNTTIHDATVMVYAPLKNAAAQRLEKLESSRPQQLLSDALGNQVMSFHFDSVPPYASMRFVVDATLSMDSARGEPLSGQPDFLRPERLIESDNPAIVAKAHELKTAARLFAWVNANLRYTGFDGDDKGAFYALKARKGDCSEFSFLFAALCRANQIPAKVVFGYVCDRDARLSPDDYHSWVEFLDDGRWEIADPQRNVFKATKRDYIAFNVYNSAPSSPMRGHHRISCAPATLKATMDK